MDDINSDDEVELVIPNGIRVNSLNTTGKIRSLLFENGRDSYLMLARNYPHGQFRADQYRAIFSNKGVPLPNANYGDGDYIKVYERPRPESSKDGAGGSSGGSSNQLKNTHKSGMGGVSNGAQPTTDPSVFIINPENERIVERGVNGVSCDGSAYDSTSVALSWTNGSDSKTVSNDNWNNILPIGPGDHKLTAKVDGDEKSVKFTVILKPAIRSYPAESIQELKTYTNKAKIRDVEQLADDLAREAGLKEETDDYAGFALSRKVKDFASKASGDFCLFYSGSGDKAFIEKQVTKIFGTHMSDETRTALVDKLEAKKTTGFVDATSEFHEAMNNTLNIFFADNSIGKIISGLDSTLILDPNMKLMIDAAKTAVNIKLNIELGLKSNGAPQLMQQEAKKNVFDMVAIEVVGMAVGGVILKVGSKAFKATKSFTQKYEFKFKKNPNQNPATRLPRENGKWDGEPGNGKWYSDKPEVIAVTKGKPVVFKNGRPDFSPWQVGKPMKFKKGMLKGDDRDFQLVYDKVAEVKGLRSNNAARIYLRDKGITPHHLDQNTIQFIKTDLHGNIPHIGSASDMRGGY